MATLQDIITQSCPLPNITCWAKRRIRDRLCELRTYLVSIRALNPIAMKRLICNYLGDDIEAIIIKVCGLMQELDDDNIVTEEFECFIIEYLNCLTSNEPFDENARRLGVPNFFYEGFVPHTT